MADKEQLDEEQIGIDDSEFFKEWEKEKAEIRKRVSRESGGLKKGLQDLRRRLTESQTESKLGSNGGPSPS